MSSVASNVIRPWNKRAPLVWNAAKQETEKSLASGRVHRQEYPQLSHVRTRLVPSLGKIPADAKLS